MVGTVAPASGVIGIGGPDGGADAPVATRAIQTFTIPRSFTAATGNPVPAQLSAAADKVLPGVVSIVSRLASQNASAAGTGMVLKSSGEVLTNNHVIADAATITVTVTSTGRSYPASVIGTNPTDDVAVLRLQGASGLATVPIGDSSKAGVGNSVAAVGNAEGGSPDVVSGRITALNQSITATDPGGGNAEDLSGLIKTDVAIKPGFSGGPLVSAAGDVIGMDTAATAFNEYLPTGMRAGYAIPINHAISVATALISGKTTGKATSAAHLESLGSAAGIKADGVRVRITHVATTRASTTRATGNTVLTGVHERDLRADPSTTGPLGAPGRPWPGSPGPAPKADPASHGRRPARRRPVRPATPTAGSDRNRM